MDIPLLRSGAEDSGFENNCPLPRHALPDHCKLYSQSTNLQALCGSSEEEEFARPTILVGPANGLRFGKGEGPLAPLPTGQGQEQGPDSQ